MSLKKIETKSTYNEGLETVSQILETCQKLIDEIPAIKGKIQKVAESIAETETFMENFKNRYVKLKPGIYEQYQPQVAHLKKQFTDLNKGLQTIWLEIQEILADEETLRLKGNDNLVYATQKLDKVNKIGIRRSGYRADHEHIKKKIGVFKSEFFRVLNLERDCQ